MQAQSPSVTINYGANLWEWGIEPHSRHSQLWVLASEDAAIEPLIAKKRAVFQNRAIKLYRNVYVLSQCSDLP